MPADPVITTSARHDRLSAGLHWIMALLLVAQLALGWWMIDLPKSPPGPRAEWFNLHKSLGIVLGMLIVVRLAWRLQHSSPAMPVHLAEWQRMAARHAHRLLYACMLVLPVSGFLGSLFSRYPVKFFGLVLPFGKWDWPLGKQVLSQVHDAAAWLLAVLVAVHVAAVVLHGMRGDGILYRMLPFRSSRMPPR